jgi:probable F420-dependent oxidoreductase
MTVMTTNTELRNRFGRTGIWMPPPERTGIDGPGLACAIEAAGFGSLWVGGGGIGPDAFDILADLLTGTTKLIVASGIASIWARPARDMRAGAGDLQARFPGRFILGLGVSHEPQVASLGRTYSRPLQTMRAYLDELGDPRSPVVLAALGPKMLELSRTRTNGAHPYFTTPEHTGTARAILGHAPLLIPEQAVVLSGDRAQGLAAGRAYAARYLRLPNYVKNLHRIGFTEVDTQADGSDRLIDAIVPHGPAALAARVKEHLDAGADHVVVQPLDASGNFSPACLHLLAEALLA